MFRLQSGIQITILHIYTLETVNRRISLLCGGGYLQMAWSEFVYIYPFYSIDMTRLYHTAVSGERLLRR